MVALAIAAEMRAVTDAASSTAGKILSCSQSAVADNGSTSVRPVTKPLFMRYVDDTAYDISNLAAPHEKHPHEGEPPKPSDEVRGAGEAL